MAAPRRHGQRHSPSPTPTAKGGDPTALRGDLTPTGPAPSKADVVPIWEVDKWIRSLPPKRITNFAISGEVPYNPALVVGDKLQIRIVDRIPANYIWVITDVFYYASRPSQLLVGPPLGIEAEALVGILKWELLFGNSAPMITTSRRMSPYTTGPAAPTSGFPWMGTPFGPQRMPSFALHATGQEDIRVEVTVEDVPQFPIVRLGANLHGFTVAEALFPATL